MEQFSLEKWLQDKSRKICTRNGNIAEIIYTNGKGAFPVIVIDPYEEETEPWQVTENGKFFLNGVDDKLDLFFADEEEELTELQKTLEEDCDCYVNLYNDGKTREELREWIKCWCNSIIDLARKEIESKTDKNFAGKEEELTEFEKELEMMMVSFSNGNLGSNVRKEMPKHKLHNYAYRLLDLARKEILKDLPKWKKITEEKQNYLAYGYLSHDGYYLSIQELKDKLPKE